MSERRERMGLAEAAERLAGVVGAEHVRQGASGDAVDGVAAGLVAAPGSADEAARALRLCAEGGLTVVPRGGGTKLGWGAPPAAADVLLETRRLSALVEHAWGDMTATVQAGCAVAELQRAVAEHGQRLACDPLWPGRATVGGVVATNDGGPLRLRFGALRDQILGVTVALSDGTLARSGGRVVKNVAGYDLPKLMTGALGTLGVIVEATFRLYPLPALVRDVRLEPQDGAAAGRALLALLDSTLAPSAVQLRAESGAAPRIDVRFEGLEAAIDAQVARLAGIAGLAAREGDPAAWGAREALWEGAGPALVCRVGVLPGEAAALLASLERVARPLRLRWRLALGALGAGWLRVEGPSEEALLAALATLRADVAGRDGTLAAMGCPAGLKGRADVWGDAGDAAPLMRRVKERFDPARALNPGRFVGGI